MRSEESNHDVTHVLRSLARDMESRHEAPPALEARVRFAYRAHRRMLRLRKSLLYGAIAASVVMLIAAGAMRLRRPPAPTESVASLRAPSPAPAVAIAVTTPPPAPKPSPKSSQVRRPAAPRRTEIVTEFLPVAGGDWLEPPGRGRLVRVKLPRAALWTYGLPMNVDRSAEAVTADVLVGDDGLARAIRFVQ
jgi:hypothetical protein